MKLSPTLMSLLAACAVFVLSPYFPTWVLELTVGTMVGSLLMLVFVLITLQHDMVVGLAVFLAVSALFLEQRRRRVIKVTSSLKSEEQLDIKELEPAPDLVPGEVHPSFKGSDIEDYGFEPSDDATNKFDQVDLSQDEKEPLDTVPPQPSEVSQLLQEKGLAEI